MGKVWDDGMEKTFEFHDRQFISQKATPFGIFTVGTYRTGTAYVGPSYAVEKIVVAVPRNGDPYWGAIIKVETFSDSNGDEDSPPHLRLTVDGERLTPRSPWYGVLR